MTEKTIQTDIMLLLGKHPLIAWSYVTSTGTFKGIKGGRPFTIGVPGMPDIMGQMKDGRMIGIEVKKPGEVPTADQILFMDMINGNNGLSFWVDSVEKVHFYLNEYLKNGHN